MSEPFVSYAQNFEDVMLWRALRGVTNGFYIDVGAAQPVADSVTNAFYERGWHGINIEPDLATFETLAAARPRDVNLNVAVSNAPGELPMYFVSAAGNSTLVEAEAQLREREGQTVTRRLVPVTTLEAIWADYVPEGQAVHFLKIDVEGAEREVIEGLNWGSNRPWVAVVEATRPNTDTPSHAGWEGIVLDAGYVLVHRDGLNRFYLSPDHPELREAFDQPPNLWDHFVIAAHRDANRRAQAADLRAEVAEQGADAAEQRAEAAERAANAAERRAEAAVRRAQASTAELAALKSSRSWRLTGPLRRAMRLLRRR